MSPEYNIIALLQKHLRELCPGMKGMIVTCNGMEKMCVTDAYRLFNEVCNCVLHTIDNYHNFSL